MRDAVFVIRIADRLKTTLTVEPHEVHLRADTDGLARKQVHRMQDRFPHEQPSNPGTTDFGMRHDSTDRRLGVLHPRRDDPCIGDQCGMLITSQDMPRTRIDPVGVEFRSRCAICCRIDL